MKTFGILRSAQDDDIKQAATTAKATAQAKTEAKPYGMISRVLCNRPPARHRFQRGGLVRSAALSDCVEVATMWSSLIETQ